ncbi:MATE family efflux transporter [Thalassospira sp. TSL5-1]|uniref:MATE family efflux transporter n=1 Tax=Thalassospira sp. TSL5-1 TaxID=1544451 RepID=UPI00093AF041|nr:MATE family efflux transporter [Thalassospira sp. TSL5-1]OKH89101.1 multidrug transporter MatE [Thalassospira sp. TSL5-1]
MSIQDVSQSSFVNGPLGKVFAKTALPIIFVMGMNGTLAIVDAVFLGMYAGADAVAAVTLIFPFFMVMNALAALVGSGMSSVLARHLGARNMVQARAVFAGAHGFSLMMAVGLMGIFALLGPALTMLLADGNALLAGLGYRYLAVLVAGVPVMFLLAVNGDALRNEGRAGLMAGLSLLVSIGNMGLNYILIAQMGLGVTGSALATVVAQMAALLMVVAYRRGPRATLRFEQTMLRDFGCAWREIVVLGVPQCLGMLGIALGAGAVIAALQLTGMAETHYAVTIGAFGIVTRVTSFVFLPILGLAQALQSVAGHNYGAGHTRRVLGSLKLAMLVALAYCALMELALGGFAGVLGRAFVPDVQVQGEVARILPIVMMAFFTVGPMMMVATFFQAIGDAALAALLGLAKPYLFALPATFLLPLWLGQGGIWLARPVADMLLLFLTLLVVLHHCRRLGGFGRV